MSECFSSYSHCITNYSKIYWHKQWFITLTDSVGQALRQGRAEMTFLCSVMYEASAEELKGWVWNHLKLCCLIGLFVLVKICYYLDSPIWQPLTNHTWLLSNGTMASAIMEVNF